MSNLPSVKRFYSEDFKEGPQYFQRFLSQLNLFTEPIYNILNGNVGVTANTTDEIYILQINSASATGANNVVLFTPKKFVGTPNGLLVGQCLIDGTTASVSSVTLSWIWTGSQISIKAIYGLSEGRNHVLTLRIF